MKWKTINFVCVCAVLVLTFFARAQESVPPLRLPAETDTAAFTFSDAAEADYLQDLEDHLAFMDGDFEPDVTALANQAGVVVEFETQSMETPPETFHARTWQEIYADATSTQPSDNPASLPWRWNGNVLTFQYTTPQPMMRTDSQALPTTVLAGQLDLPLGKTGWNVRMHAALSVLPDRASQTASLNTTLHARSAVNTYMATAEVSGAVRNVDLYTEFGVVGGTAERIRLEPEPLPLKPRSVNAKRVAPTLQEDAAQETSRYYVSSGARLAFGPWQFGIEAGYGRGDEPSQALVTQQAVNGILASALEKQVDAADIIYVEGKAGLAPFKRLGMSIGTMYLATPEEFVSVLTNERARAYGIEFFGDINYRFANSMRYVIYWGYALPDADITADGLYQIFNRVEVDF